MQQQITIRYADGRVADATLGPREFIEFERKFGVSVQELASNAHIEWVYYLAYLGARRLHRTGEHPGAIKPDFDGFLDVVDEVDLVVDDGDGAAPLGEAAS